MRHGRSAWFRLSPVSRGRCPAPRRPMQTATHRGSIWPLRAMLGLALFVWTACPAGFASQAGNVAATSDAQEREQLARWREAGDWAAAIDYCRRALEPADPATPALASRRRAELTCELAETLAARALTLPAAEQRSAWNETYEPLRQYLLRFPQDPGRWMVATQRGLVLLIEGEHLARRAELEPNARELSAEARQRVHDAIGRFDDLARELGAELRQPARDRGRNSDWKPAELAELARQAEYQLARGYCRLAELFPAASAERADALAQARERLRGWARADRGDRWSWRARLDEVTCLRLLGELEPAQAHLAALTESNPPPELAEALEVETWRVGLATDALGTARAILTAEPPVAPEAGEPSASSLPSATKNVHGADWYGARLECLAAGAAAADQAGEAPLAAELRAEGERTARVLAEQFGPVWRARAARVWAAPGAAPAGGQPDLWAAAADEAYRARRLDEAQTAYDSAVAAARAAADSNAAFDLAYRAAAIDHERERHAEAATRFRKLSLDIWDHPRAAEAHLLAVHHALQVARADDPPNLDGYRELLAEHLRMWPQDATAGEAAWQLGRLEQAAGQAEAALGAWRRIPPEHPRSAEAARGVGEVIAVLVAEARAAGRDPAPLVAQAEQYFRAQLYGPQGEWPESWTDARRAALLALAGLWISETHDGAARAARLLSQGLAGPELPAEWRSQATLYLAWGESRSGNLDAAKERMRRWVPASAAATVSTLAECARWARAPTPAGEALVEPALAFAEVQRPKLLRWDETPRREFLRSEAILFARAGRAAEARQRYDELTAGTAGDAELLVELAELISARDDQASLGAALDLWRELERRSRPESDRWYRAKWELADLHRRRGHPEQAARVITVTRLLHPELGGATWQAKFEALERLVASPGK